MVNEMETQVFVDNKAAASFFGKMLKLKTFFSWIQSKKLIYSVVAFALSLGLQTVLNLNSAQAHTIVQSFENHAPDAWSVRGEATPSFILEPQFNYFNTDQNFIADGSTFPSAGLASVRRYYASALGSFAFDESWYGYARLTFVSSDVFSNFIIGTSTGLGDQLVGLGYTAWNDSSGTLRFQFEAIIPAYNNSNAKTSAVPYLGDASYDFTLGGLYSLPIASQSASGLSLDFAAAFTKRTFGYSSAIPWNVYLKKVTDEGLGFQAGVRGQVSMQTDATSILAASSDQNRGAGGSYLVNAVNPSWVNVDVRLAYQIRQGMNLYAQGSSVFFGTNAPKGTQIQVGAIIPFGLDASNTTESDRAIHRSSDRASAVPRVKPSEKSDYDPTRTSEFMSYDLDANVASVNDQLYIAKISRGKRDGIEKGQFFDVFSGEKRIARCKVAEVKRDEAILSVVEYFIETWIDVGFQARRLIK